MPSFLQVDNLSKSYGPKILFENISFNINEGDKIALVAPNGTGKTSLLRILAGTDKSDRGGSIKFLKDIRIAFLEQESDFEMDKTIAQILFDQDFEKEIRTRRILSELSLNPERKISELSGGEIKRVAITKMLAQQAEFLIMDEPTNHLDVDGIEYLEKELKKSRCTLFMVTHDRYFLDRVCNSVMEMDHGAIYTYKGDYENYLTKRDERIANYNAETDKVRNILRRELEWMHATPCARSGKAKYRKQAFWELKDRAEQAYTRGTVSMDELRTLARMGSKVIDCKGLSFGYGNKLIVKDFTYNFQRGERVGIVGANGIGKTSFIDLLVSGTEPQVQRGESLKIGYYKQCGIEFNDDDTVMDIVPDTHLLGKFLFPHDMFSNKVGRLSGGEKRRLYLLTILMQNPNMLILDEPTNDLDIITLNVLEEYLLDFKGTLVVVTHDRHFLDRIVDHLLVFTGEGQIKDFLGGYSEYRSFITDLEAERKASAKGAASAQQSSGEEASGKVKTQVKRKLSFKEKREFEELELRIEALGKEKSEIEALLGGGSSDIAAISAASARYAILKDELDEAELRWLELSCI